ncbi:MAG: membrane protein insertase YidC [Treponema sp.]|jgi:YidC/Oxa1 family membrane protein insertase|nr:membrane protein insertase YidC [Treponema sp.]
MNPLYNIIIFPIIQIIEFVFVFTQSIFKEIGLALIGVSIAVSVLCLPLYNVAEKWQTLERDLQKKMKPRVDKIKTVFKGDEQYMILSTYYRQNNYHPVYAMRSTFGLLIQIPFFIAAYSYLSHLEALKDAHFFIFTNLGAPDSLLKIGGVSINILPVFMTFANIISGAVYSRGLPPKDKVQLYGMAAVFLIILYNSPAGLVLYWTFNNIFSLAKNCYFSIKFRHRNTVLYIFISLLFVLFGLYVLFVLRGGNNIKKVIAMASCLAALFPWAIRLANKHIAHKGFFHLSKNAVTGIFIASCLCIWALLGLVTPSLLIASSPNEFSFIDTYDNPLFFLLNTALQSLGFFIFWPLCLYALFPAKIKKMFAAVFMIMAVMAACDILLFPGDYGFITVALEFSDNIDHTISDYVINVLCLLTSVSVFLFLFVKGFIRIIVPVLSMCFVSFCVLTLINIAKIEQSYVQLTGFYDVENKTAAEIIPLFHLSKTGKNVVVIMLDKAASAFISFIFEEDLELNDAYSGFVFYPNTVSFSHHTNYGAPPIFGGYDSTPQAFNNRSDVTLRQKHNEALLMLPVIFSTAGYSVTVTDLPYVNYVNPSDMSFFDSLPNTKGFITDAVYTDIWLQEHDFSFPAVSDTLKRNIFWYSLLRASPYVLRRGIYLNGSWCSLAPNSFLIGTLNGYSVLDYLPRLTDFNAKTENTVILSVNMATHKPSFLQAPDYRPVPFVTDFGKGPFRNSSNYHVNIASIKRLADWFNFLKENNAYDNTRIILVSDHGPYENIAAKAGLPFILDSFNSLLLVKDFNASGPMRADDTFMSSGDVPSLALQGLFDDPRNPYTGNPINMDTKQKPLYIFTSNPYGDEHLVFADETRVRLESKKDYYVHGNIFDPANWEKAEP